MSSTDSLLSVSRLPPSWTGSADRATTKSELAYATIRQRILENELVAGTPIDQEALAASLNLSTTPVREALRRLEAERLVISRAHRDTIVTTISQELIDDTYEIRLPLDSLAASLAATNATEAQREHMKSFLSGAPQGASLMERFYFNRHFHRAIYGACGNESLIQILEHLWDVSDRHRWAVLKSDRVMREVEKDHKVIIKTVLAGDAQRAGELMREHVENSRDSFQS